MTWERVERGLYLTVLGLGGYSALMAVLALLTGNVDPFLAYLVSAAVCLGAVPILRALLTELLTPERTEHDG